MDSQLEQITRGIVSLLDNATARQAAHPAIESIIGAEIHGLRLALSVIAGNLELGYADRLIEWAHGQRELVRATDVTALAVDNRWPPVPVGGWEPRS
jgi:hypothetical protein